MDTRRCLEILELESVGSPEDLKQAYRDMVQVWHPDRFHGNARLQKLTGVKLREINYAYDHLLEFFDPEKRTRSKTSDEPPHARSSNTEKQSTGAHFGKQTGNYSYADDDSNGEQSTQFRHVKVYPPAKKSSLGKYILLIVLCIFLSVSGVVVYFLINIDKITANSARLASEVMQIFKTEMEKNTAIQIEEYKTVPKISPPSQPESQDTIKNIIPTEAKQYFEIHLKSGTIIMTDSWWQERDMIMFKQHGGSMGVEKSIVKRIVDRETTKTNLLFLEANR